MVIYLLSFKVEISLYNSDVFESIEPHLVFQVQGILGAHFFFFSGEINTIDSDLTQQISLHLHYIFYSLLRKSVKYKK